MQAKKFIGKVLPDGHLSLPENFAKETGKIYEVILIPIEEADIYPYTEALAEEKGFSKLTEEDIEKIIHESRGLY
ncbi:MAG: hypothetical protein ACPL1G_01025 [Thermodesulfovibrionales bacterium]